MVTKDFKETVGIRESSGDYASDTNEFGYRGKYQFGEAALVDIGVYVADGTNANDWKGQFSEAFQSQYDVKTIDDFLASPEAQEAAYMLYLNKNWNYVQSLGLEDYLNQTFRFEGKEYSITRESLLFASQLGIGNLNKFLKEGAQFQDGFGTDIREYLALGSQTELDAETAAHLFGQDYYAVQEDKKRRQADAEQLTGSPQVKAPTQNVTPPLKPDADSVQGADDEDYTTLVTPNKVSDSPRQEAGFWDTLVVAAAAITVAAMRQQPDALVDEGIRPFTKESPSRGY